MNHVSHLECANCGVRYDRDAIHNLCLSCQRPLVVRYNLEAVGGTLTKQALLHRPSTMWRYHELLPLSNVEKAVALGETMTPILQCDRLAAAMGIDNLAIKDESRLPTGSFKSRGMAMAISKAREFGITRVAVPTAGNAGGALAAYAARAGMQSYVFMPEDTPAINRKECYLAGARTFLVNGLITDCGRIVAAGKEKAGWFDVSTLKEPYRIEGKKTMGLELAEQYDWELPDVILYPTGGGTGLIGMWKAFAELEAIDWLGATPHKPRMISCQSTGCAPIAQAFDEGARFARPFENAATMASGIRVPAAVGDFMILEAVRASGGLAVAAPEEDIPRWMQLANAKEGIAVCPETAICLGALEMLLNSGQISRSERILVFNTGAGQKYPEVIDEKLDHIDISKLIDWEKILQ